MKRLPKFNKPSDLIDHYIKLKPHVTYKTSESVIRSTAAVITSELIKQFGKGNTITEYIDSAEAKPPFSVWWEIKANVPAKRGRKPKSITIDAPLTS